MVGTTSITVQVPKNMMGKVIGRGAATKLDIESDYSVNLTIPGRNDASDLVRIDGPADKVEFAKTRILDIIGQGGNKTDDARAEARKCYDAADALFERAKHAGSADEARSLKSQAHEKRAEGQRANDRAAKEIFASKNGGYQDDQMDLHGLYLKEAMDVVEERLRKVDARLRSGQMDLVIIVGQGIHSSGAAKIKPAVAEHLSKNGYPFEDDPAGGQFTVSFSNAPQASATTSVPQPAPATATAAPAPAAAAPAGGAAPQKESDAKSNAKLMAQLCSAATAVFWAVKSCFDKRSKDKAEEPQTQSRSVPSSEPTEGAAAPTPAAAHVARV